MEISSYNLSWPKFTSCFTSSFRTLSESELFSDITLICEQNRQLKAHKIILGACSSFFRNILGSLPPHPTHLYVDGVSYQHLNDAISLMYLGEVKVEKENLDDFMKVCKKLEILGLTGESMASFNDDAAALKEVTQDNEDSDTILKEEDDPHQQHITDNLSESEHIDDTVEDILEDVEPDVNSELTMMKDFKPARVIRDGKSVYRCGTCDYVSSGKHHLKYHIDSKHLNIRYPCGICDYSSQQPSDLKKHKKFIHDKIRDYACSACTYKAFDKAGLARHATSKRCPIKEGGRIKKKLQSTLS